MQTFLAFSDFARSASVLDRLRLGKQRIEAKQIYMALADDNYGWRNHPCTRSWFGYPGALAAYGIAVCTEWRGRGYVDNQLNWFKDRAEANFDLPDWIGNEAFHRAHQSKLIHKNSAHYTPLFPGVPDNLAYIWPV